MTNILPTCSAASTCDLRVFPAFYCRSNRFKETLSEDSGNALQSTGKVKETSSAFLPESDMKSMWPAWKWLGSGVHLKLFHTSFFEEQEQSKCTFLTINWKGVCTYFDKHLLFLSIYTFQLLSGCLFCCWVAQTWHFYVHISTFRKKTSRINFFFGFAHLKFHLRMEFPVKHNFSPCCDRKTPNNKHYCSCVTIYCSVRE